MSKFWEALLRKAIAALLSKDWATVIEEVGHLMSVQLDGNEKRLIAYNQLRKAGIEVATWLLYAAIEIAYGSIKARQSQ